MNYKALIIESGKKMAASGLTVETWGNISAYDPETGLSVAGNWILYSSEETYRLYSGAESPHLEDGAARRAAELLTALNAETEEIK